MIHYYVYMKLPQTTSWKSTQLMSTKKYELNFYKDKDFKTVSLHSHDFYELYYFVNGSATYIIESGHYKLLPGDVLIIPPKKLHQLDIYDSEQEYERIVLWLNPSYVKKLSTSKTNLAKAFVEVTENQNYLIRNANYSKTLFDVLTKPSACSKSNDFGADIEEENVLKTLLILLYKILVRGGFSKPETNETVKKVVDYIETHLGDKLTLDLLAEKAFVSKYYLAHVFKEETNTSPHKYILKRKLILAKELIEQGTPSNEVYEKCGFVDYTHFLRAFKLEYGMTPTEYKNISKILN